MFNEKKISFKILSVLKLSWSKNTAYASARPFYALSLRLSGNADFTHAKNIYHVETNDIIFVPKDYDYTITSKKDETTLVVHFDILDDTFDQIETFTPINSEIFVDLFQKIYDAWHKKPLGYEYRIDSLFLRILENIAVQTFRQTHDVKHNFFSLLDYLHSNFTDQTLSVEKLAARINISTTYLRQLFTVNLKTTPAKYITKLRLDYASQLLQSGYYTVEEVAELCGYNDSKYFSTSYKKHTGNSPIKTKKSIKIKEL